MALSNYQIPRTKVDLDPENSISVRGLNLEDISFLVQVHKNDVDNVVAMFQGKLGKDKTPEGISKAVQDNGDAMLVELIQKFPMLIANVISVAADEPEAWETASKLPMPVQVEAVLAITKRTFNDVDGFKKFVGNVSAVLQSVATQSPQMMKAAKKSTGTTASVETRPS